MPIVTVTVGVTGVNGAVLEGARVRLSERDLAGGDEVFGDVIANSAGQASFEVGAALLDLDDPQSPRGPELRVQVWDTAGSPIFDGRPAPVGRGVALQLRVEVPADVVSASAAAQRARSPRPSGNPGWAKKLPPVSDPCITRAVLSMMANVAKPRTAFQKSLASSFSARLQAMEATPDVASRESLPSNIGSRLRPVDPNRGVERRAVESRASAAQREAIEHISAKAAEMLQALDASNPAAAACPPLETPKDIADHILSKNPKIRQLLGALDAGEAKFEEEGQPARAGEPFFERSEEFIKGCRERFTGTARPRLDPAVQRVMENLGAANHAHYEVIRDPRINLVEVLDPRLPHVAYAGHVASKTVEVLPRSEGLASTLLNFDVPLTAPPAGQVDLRVINKSDVSVAGVPRQIMMLDVGKGHKIRFAGSGFINAKAQVLCRRQGFSAEADEGMLVPLPIVTDRSFATPADVHGGVSPRSASDTAESYQGDRVIIEWPFAEPGLYEVRLRFTNDAGHIRNGQQDPTTCAIAADTPEAFESNTVWLAVIPMIERARLFPRLTEIRCLDRSNIGPVESWEDDVRATGRLERTAFTTSDAAQVAALGVLGADFERTDRFFADGQMRSVQQEFPGAGFGVDQLVADLTFKLHVELTELLGDKERFAIKAVEVLVAVIVAAIFLELVGRTASFAFLILFPLLMLAGYVTGPVAVGAGAAGTAGTASALITLLLLAGPAAKDAMSVSLGITRFSFENLLPLVIEGLKAADAALWAFLEAEFGERRLLSYGTSMTVAELFARSSPFRVFNRLMPDSRPGFSASGFTETHREKRLGGEYEIKVEVGMQRVPVV